MNHQLTAEDMAEVAAAEYKATKRADWYAVTWRHLQQPKPVYSKREGSPERDKVLAAIAQGCKTRDEIIAHTGKSKQAVGGQCKRLLHMGLIVADRIGAVHSYRLTASGVARLKEQEAMQ